MEYNREWLEDAIVKIKSKSQVTKAESGELLLQIHEHDLKTLVGCTAWLQFAPEHLGMSHDVFLELVACAKFQRWARQRYGWQGTITIQALHNVKGMSGEQLRSLFNSVESDKDINNYDVRNFNNRANREVNMRVTDDEEWFLRTSLAHVRKNPEVLTGLIAKRYNNK